ncbi:DUF1805 domain-containing protein [Candidatus Bathyarchaeota archaeon]|nr:MAG: DUF1805 domain-containing protein [Candidatus Bathyarchaeota archaeon]
MSVSVRLVGVKERLALGVRVELPESPPLLVVVGDKGFIMCGYLNLDVAEELGAVAATVSGVRTVDDVLEAPIRGLTSRARDLGIKEGMKGIEALELMMGPDERPQ